ncbi:NUDIX domain-containing protein [Streptomyces sp. NPDC018347]|uniref:NUDIX domain-containing protein n=1 Tax=Streptomyces sp. NPDC018347 TaxID=3157193 RepID=UPI00340A2352
MTDEEYGALRAAAALWVGTSVLITDGRGRILVQHVDYRTTCLLPGGAVDGNEPPAQGAARELREELGITMTVDRALAVDWVSADSINAPAGMRFPGEILHVYDGGTWDNPVPECQVASWTGECRCRSRGGRGGGRWPGVPAGPARHVEDPSAGPQGRQGHEGGEEPAVEGAGGDAGEVAGGGVAAGEAQRVVVFVGDGASGCGDQVGGGDVPGAGAHIRATVAACPRATSTRARVDS